MIDQTIVPGYVIVWSASLEKAAHDAQVKPAPAPPVPVHSRLALWFTESDHATRSDKAMKEKLR
jgi:hypothetical protein